MNTRSQPTKVFDSVVIPVKGIRTGCRTRPPMDLLAMVMGRGSWLVVVIACKTRFTLVNDPDNHIWIAHVGYPDVLWSGRIYESRPDVYALKIRMRVTRMTMRVMCHYKMRVTCHVSLARHIERSKNVKAPKRIERESSGRPGLSTKNEKGDARDVPRHF
uniref:Uncharacterized protein n=1 Tax=Vitis vinifera TaxID=29760 RepID=A5AFY7_VITVI|nr:hypothetical protein VITISV_031341 [Vitis vinifera]